MMDALGNPELWARFGLPGLVIFALFVGALIFIGWAVRHVSELTKLHYKERQEWMELSKEERTEWREVNSISSDKLSNALDGLRDAINDMKRPTRR